MCMYSPAMYNAENRCQVIRYSLTAIFSLFIYIIILLDYNRLVLRYEQLHYRPTDEVSHGAYAEDNHIACRLALKAHEGEGTTLCFSVSEEVTRNLVDEE